MDNKNKILLIDDNPSIRTFLRVPLSSSFEILEAESAANGLELYQTNLPNLVILDLGLPDKEGFYVLEKIRAKDDETKVIILTVRDDSDSRKKAQELGADYYLTKPFRYGEIVNLINDFIK